MQQTLRTKTPPKKLTLPQGEIHYIYTANGQKLKKTVTEGTTNKTVDYLDGFQYTNEKLDFFSTAEGYVTLNINQLNHFYNYVFNYTDHLAAARLHRVCHASLLLNCMNSGSYIL